MEIDSILLTAPDLICNYQPDRGDGGWRAGQGRKAEKTSKDNLHGFCACARARLLEQEQFQRSS